MAYRTTVENLRAVFYLLYFCLPNVILALIIASRFSQWTKYAFLACYLYAGTFVSRYRTGHVWIDYSMGATLGGFYFSHLHLVTVDPLKQYRHKSDDPEMGPNKLSWAGRVYWVWCAIVSVRGVGWNYQMPHISTPRHISRFKFILSTLVKLVYYFFLVDLCQTILEVAPFLQNTTANFSIRLLPFPQRVLAVVSWFLGGYAGIYFQYYTFGLICVAVGYNSSVDWPAPFGHWADAYSIRNFWSKTWHSFLRRLCMSPGRNLTRILGIPAKSLPASTIQLYTTFLVSAIVHSLGDFMIGRQYLGVSLPFFLIQPVGITIEEVFKYFVRRCTRSGAHSVTSKSGSEPSSTVRVIGYIWVLWWFTVTAPLLLDPATQVGFNKERMFPFSPVSSILASLYPSAFDAVNS